MLSGYIAPQSRQRGKGMAIWAFVLACCSILLSALTAIPAIILGIISLTGRRAGRGLAIAALIVAPVLAVTELVLLIQVRAMVGREVADLWRQIEQDGGQPLARETTRRALCGANLNGLGKALAIYASNNNDQQPTNLDALIQQGSINEKMLHCPSDSSQISPDRRDYFYMPLPPDADSTALNACEFAANHPGATRNILTYDGRVCWVNEREFQNLFLLRPENAEFAAALEEAQRRR
jgi:hypothetical protein